MIETIHYDGVDYPKFQASGNAARFAIPFALEVCKGVGYDIGCNRADWALPGAILIDPVIDSNWSATKLPASQVDYIFSSHCLEHLHDWVYVLQYWRSKLLEGGVIFLYLPHPNQKYWQPWNNRKHVNLLYPDDVANCLKKIGFHNIHTSGQDLNHSYIVMAEKYKYPI